MNGVFMILAIIGAAFMLIGLTVTIAFSSLMGFSAFCLIPLMFVIIGACFLIGVFVCLKKKKDIIRNGTRYAGKIYGYVEDRSILVNGSYPVNVKIHYFDRNHMEKEAIIPTQFPKGSSQYAIGMTLDIYEYNGKYNWDPKSVRNEMLKGEEELMDNKPVEPEKLTLTAASCPHCGSTFQAARGYVSKCPYCGSYLNV